MGGNGLAWWQRAVIYEVYPRSFQDSDGDGVGDLNGLIRRLDYLAWLGVDAVWLCPVQPSPMKDFGYDISDFCNIDPLFGTLKDFDRLLAEMHARGLKLILDLVPNHTSDRHPWFLDSRKSKDSRKRDWYVWRDPSPDGAPPNNWRGQFGGSAWSFDEATGQYYYHAFLPSQPDLNWWNPDVQTAMLDVMRFWLQRGVDGFRVDAATNLIEDNLFRDDPPNPAFREGMQDGERFTRAYSLDRPETHRHLEWMRTILDEFSGRVLIGEIHLPVARAMAYFGGAYPTFHLPFNFELLQTPWHSHCLGAAIDQYTIRLPKKGWPNWVLGNHDEARIATRLGAAQARIAAMLLLTLRGTVFVYYGDELGMANTDLPQERPQDPRGAMMGANYFRDESRTPMLWDAAVGAGFTSGEPWLPFDPDYPVINVAAQQADNRSILSLYHRLIALRREMPALREGEQIPLRPSEAVFAFQRRLADQTLLIAFNLYDDAQTFPLAAPGTLLLSTELDRENVLRTFA
jgi:alpha-glucosidase